MNAQDLRKVLEETDNKFSILANKETLTKYTLTVKDFLDLINDFLSDAEKLQLFNFSHFVNFEPYIKFGIIDLISDDNIMLQILINDDIMSGFAEYQIAEILKKLNDTVKMQLLCNKDFISKLKLENHQLKDIISTLSEEKQYKLLTDTDNITNTFNLSNFQIVSLINALSSDEFKYQLFQAYEMNDFYKCNIVATMSDKFKLTALLNEKDFNKYYKIQILQSLTVRSLGEFFSEQKEFCKENSIHPYEVILKLDSTHQKDFISNLQQIDLSLNEKREILATLNEDVKKDIDFSTLPKEYRTALSIQTSSSSGKVSLDLNRNLEDYRGLDNLMYINPENFNEEQRAKFIELCNICPNLQVINTLNNSVEFFSTASEYINAEQWISSIIDNLNPEYSKAQKMAIIDNAIGKKISYSPDFDTEVSNSNNCRSLWKIISSGYGVCNGISRVEQYIFDRIGIKSELISSNSHAFLKIKDIELPLASGEIAKGTTILDPTWNLTNHRFNGFPNNFCMSYKQARKNDIDINGKDHNSHMNNEQLNDATLNLDEQSLRQLFASVGLANKDGSFPIKDFVEKSKLLDQIYATEPEQNINKQFLLLSKTCPEFATCQNSSMSILSSVLLNNKNLKFDKCVVNRVYDKSDKEKHPILFVYISSNEIGEKFYFADKHSGQFVEMTHNEFINQFDSYDTDLSKANGIRPWEVPQNHKADIDLSKNSGKVITEEGEER